MNNKLSKISSILNRLHFCMSVPASIMQGVLLFRNYSKFSIAIRKGSRGKKILQSQHVYKIKIKMESGNPLIHYRIQDVPLIFEIFQNKIYNIKRVTQNRGHIIDLGANIGLTSLYFSGVYGSTNPIISVEPSRQNNKLLELNLDLYTHITTIPTAVSNTDGVASFYDDGLGYNSKLDDSGDSTYEISTISMATLISNQNIEEIEVLKIDIEGAEEVLFEGDIDWLRIVKNVIIEIHNPDFVDTLAQVLMHYGLKFVEKRDSVYLYSKR